MSHDDDSSSLLPPSPDQLAAAPKSSTDRVEFVDKKRADSVLEADVLSAPVLLKIDVQGTELAVLEGFGDRLDDVDFVLVELSLVELYLGQQLASEIISWLFLRGFEVNRIGAPTLFEDVQLQADILFARASSGGRTN